MKTRKTFSVMLVICMLLSLVFPSSGGGVSNAASASDKVTVIDVTQYGADPTGVKDSAEGIQAAIEAAKEVNGPVVLDFPKGEYQIYPDHAQKRELYISNTLSRNNVQNEKYRYSAGKYGKCDTGRKSVQSDLPWQDDDVFHDRM